MKVRISHRIIFVCLGLFIPVCIKSISNNANPNVNLTRTTRVLTADSMDGEFLYVPPCGSCDTIHYVNFFDTYEKEKEFEGAKVYITYHDFFISNYLDCGFTIRIVDNKLDVFIYRAGVESYFQIDYHKRRTIDTKVLEKLLKQLNQCYLVSVPFGIPEYKNYELNGFSKFKRLVILTPTMHIMGGDLASSLPGGNQTDFVKIDSLDRCRSFNIGGNYTKAVEIIQSLLSTKEINLINKGDD